FLIIISCKSTQVISQETNTKIDCLENPDFRKKFFSSIEYVDYVYNLKYTGDNDSISDFESIKRLKEKYNLSLGFISEYAHVSWEKRLNYDNSYPTVADYEQDKAGWLQWYEENKCNNIQIKTLKP